MSPDDTCGNCGAAFERAKTSQRFCSRACQRAALTRQDKAARALYRAALGIIGTEMAAAAVPIPAMQYVKDR